MSIEINGTASDGWEPLIDLFASNFDRYSELGASVCVTYEGETVVDVSVSNTHLTLPPKRIV